MTPETPIFKTDRLLVGRWSPELAQPALSIYGDSEVTRWLDGVTYSSVEAMRNRISELVARNQKWPNHFGSWPAFLKSTGELVGTLLMKPLPDAAGNSTSDIEIGWHLGRAHWGHGYATEGARRMVEIAFDQLKLPELLAVTRTDNLASQQVATRIGMNHLGTTEAYYGQTLELFKIIRPVRNPDLRYSNLQSKFNEE